MGLWIYSLLDWQNFRFLAKFASPAVEDVERRFIITYYMADDTISIFEKPDRNTGFTAGKFLERSRLKNVKSGKFFEPKVRLCKIP